MRLYGTAQRPASRLREGLLNHFGGTRFAGPAMGGGLEIDRQRPTPLHPPQPAFITLMGNIHGPAPVLLLVAVSSRYPEALEWTQRRFADAFGSLLPASDRFPFEQTDYYRASMGSELFKAFLAVEQPIDPGQLASVKIRTNAWEEEYAAAAGHPEPRPLNLDPGYLAEDKLVLASTKNHAHRLYLSDGIYAEFTLQFRGRRWQNCPWTYPDYQQASYHNFFTGCRNHLRSVLSRRPPAPA